MDTAKLFMNGRSQAVRLPKEYRFEGSEVYIRKVGPTVILIPYHEPWQTLKQSLDMFSDDFMDSYVPLEPQIREEAFE
jgi:antitoxin VapB